MARALNAEGAHLALAARREEALLEIQADLESGDGRKCMVFPTDVTDREEVRSLVARAEEELGPVEVNCKGALNCVGAVLSGMLERGRGHIVTISSDAGRKVFPGLAVYSASKFFVEALSQGLRLETAGMGVKVTTIQPGNVATDLISMSGDEEALEEYGQPGESRVLDPENVAASVVHALVQPEHVAVNEILVEPRDEPI